MTTPSPPPRRSKGPAPVRALGSIRRTSNIDVTWPHGGPQPARFTGRGRDLVTPRSGDAPIAVAEDSFEATIRSDRTIESIAADPPRPGLAQLAGRRSGGLRKSLLEIIPEERRQGTPLQLLLDDVPIVSMVSMVAWSLWDPDWLERSYRGVALESLLKSRENVCFANSPGSTAQDPALAGGKAYERAAAAELVRPDDLAGWHRLETQNDVGMRRARRIDVTVSDVIVIDAEFQDSISRPDGGRAAVHEYGLTATADPRSLKLLSLAADPRVLPYPECPGAASNISRLIGLPLSELRERVPIDLPGAIGCTHLNDALRALTDVPLMLRHHR